MSLQAWVCVCACEGQAVLDVVPHVLTLLTGVKKILDV